MSDNVRIVSCVDDFEGYFIASLNGHAEAVIKSGEDFAWVDEQPLALAMAYEDAAVVTRVDAVAGFYHRAETRHHGVVVDVMLARAGGANADD